MPTLKYLASIIIPAYNVQDYIKECLISIANQNYDDAFECIIIDDCGSDNSMEIVSDFIKQYKGNIKFRTLSHEKNKGLSAARNTGIKTATGEYLLFVDSDDYLFPNCLSSFAETLRKYPDAQLIQAGAKLSTGDREDYYSMEKTFPEYATNKEWIARTFLKRGGWQGVPVTAWNRLVKRSFILDNNLFFKEGILHEDEPWNFMLAQKLSKVAFCKHDTYYYRIRNNSIMTSLDEDDTKAKSIIPAWKEMKKNFCKEMAKLQAKMLWGHIHEYYPKCQDKDLKKEIRRYLWWIIQKGIWPTSLLVFIYLTPIGFHLRFLRKMIIKGARIDNASVSPLL